MQRKTQGASLQTILEHVFADQPRQGRSGCANVNGASVAVPATRTSEDRSRMRHKVLDELARRDQARREAGAACTEPKSDPHNPVIGAQPSLFADAVSASGVQRPHVVAAPRRGMRSLGDVRDLVAEGYRSLIRRIPEDHVVLDPIANAEFIVRCRELGATVSEVVLNRTLLNNRKAKKHADVLREPVSGLQRGIYDQIGYAVEIAASLVQREWLARGDVLPSVDDILCDPELRRAFRTYVQELHDGADIINCHLVLLAYRKSGRESAQRLASVDIPDPLFTASLRSLDPDDVPEGCGIYRVLCKHKAIFVSGTANLRRRVMRHLVSRDDGFLPPSLPFAVEGPVSIQVYAAPPQWLPRRADAVARSLRRGEYPDLNWREKGVLFQDSGLVVPRLAAVG